MDKMDDELDKILLMIKRMPDGEIKEKLMARYNSYRSKFQESGKSISAVSPLGLEILKFEVDIEAFISGMPNVNPLRDYRIIQPSFAEQKTEKQKNTQEIESILIEILNSKISIGDVESLKGIIEDVQKEYKGLKSNNQELDLKIAEANYVLMKSLLKDGKIEEAFELTKKFDTDMSLFLFEKLSPKVDELRRNGRLEDALFLAKYCKNGEPRETDLKFWERVINIEKPDINFKLPEIDKEQIQEKPKNEGFIARAKKKMKQLHADKEYKREKNVKVMHIRYDPKSDFYNMNKNDYKKVMKAICAEEDKNGNQKEKSNIKVIFDEGIKEITFYSLDKKPHLCEVEFPTSLEEIKDGCFQGCDNLKNVDLSHCKVKKIGDFAFSNLRLETILLPNSLESIGDSAFRLCLYLKSIDLSRCHITEITDSAFLWSGLEKILLPKSVESIGDSAFKFCSNLKSIDLSHCNLTNIAKEAFSFSGLETILLPDSLEEIGESAFLGCKGIKNIDLSNCKTTQIGDSAFKYSGLEKIIITNSIETIFDSSFEKCERLKRIHGQESTAPSVDLKKGKKSKKIDKVIEEPNDKKKLKDKQER